MLILVRFEESIDGNGHRADLDCAKKAVKKFGNVGNQQKNALFGAHTQPTKRVAHAVCVRQQMTIGDTFVAAFNCDFFSSAFGGIMVNKVSGDVERASVAVVNSEMIDGRRSGVGSARVESPVQLMAAD